MTGSTKSGGGATMAARFRADHYALDALAWVIALIAAVVLRYDFPTPQVSWVHLIALCVVVMVVQLLAGGALSLYDGRYARGSFEEVRALLYSVAATAVICGIPVALWGVQLALARSLVFIAFPIAFVLAGGVRYLKRLYAEQQVRPDDEAAPTLVYGAGYMGEFLVRRMLSDPDLRFRAVGLIDDDPARRRLRLRGVSVLGDGSELSQIAEQTGARVLVIAIAHAEAPLLRAISDRAEQAGLRVMVLPPLNDVLRGRAKLGDVRDIAIEDLIGRHPVDTDVASIAGYVTGKRVLVTGAGGSIGSELCRQVMKFGPAELMMLDRDETGLQVTQLSVDGHGLLNTKDVVLANIRDVQALMEIFGERRPQVVFHAAALKHLPMLEQYPEEGWKTNVLGTRNVLAAARSVNVETFVNVSTDKAANPTSVLGYSKRLGEKLTAWSAEVTGRRYLSVRFGNVIGSRGSMLPTFQTLIEAGGPVTVTHPDMTRYFMTIPEACQLVVQAGGIGDPGEVLILDMGEPVRILDIARRMIDVSGKDIEIVYTGLRHGEKIHEELIGHGETDARPRHPKISQAKVSGMSPESLDHDRWAAQLRDAVVDVVEGRSAASVRRAGA